VREMNRVEPCDTCANRPGCETKFYGSGCHYYPAWGSPAFDRIRNRAREGAFSMRVTDKEDK